MPAGIKKIIYPVKDLDRAKVLYRALLGSDPEIELPTYIEFAFGDQHLGLVLNGHTRGFTGSTGYWHVDDIDARFQELLAAGGTEHESPRDVGNGDYIASFKDPDGNIIGLYQSAQVLQS